MSAREWKKRAEGLGARVRDRRRELGLAQWRLADKAGTSQAVVQKVENGKSLRPRILEELAAALDVTPVWLSHGVTTLDPGDHDVAKRFHRLGKAGQRAVVRAIQEAERVARNTA